MRPEIFASGLFLIGIGLFVMLFGYSVVLGPSYPNVLNVPASQAVHAGGLLEFIGGLLFSFGLAISGYGAASRRTSQR